MTGSQYISRMLQGYGIKDVFVMPYILTPVLRDPKDFPGALDQALTCGRPALMDVKTDIESIAPLPWLPAE